MIRNVVVFTAISGMFAAGASAGQEAHEHQASPGQATIAIPSSLQVEHGHIHETLIEATRQPGSVGGAATALAKVLHPHFVREEEIALPPLGLLAPLAAGAHGPGLREVLKMTDALRQEMPRMLEEHKAIHAATEKLLEAARAEAAPRFERLAQDLLLHAQTEEQVTYPAALLVGEVVRARLQLR